MALAKNLQDRICRRVEAEISPNCMHRLPSGACQQPQDFPCPIHNNVDGIIEVVRSASSNSIEPYVRKLREIVCKKCQMLDEFGECKLRDNLDCCLDAFIVLIVKIVEEELAREQ